MERGKIGFVVGLTAEARLLRGLGFIVVAGGGTPEGAGAAARQCCEAGAAFLISFGLCGGLEPALPPGAIVIPRAVIGTRRAFDCDPRLVAWLGGATTGRLLAGDAIAVTAARKAVLFGQYGAAAVDLESGAVARIAAARGLPFAVLRAVADPAKRDLPPVALNALDPQGRIDLRRVAASLLRQPGQIVGLIALANDARRARAALISRLKRLG